MVLYCRTITGNHREKSSKLSEIYSGQQEDYCQQKIKWKLEFLKFLSNFQEYERQKQYIKQIRWQRVPNPVPLQHQH